MRIPASDVLLTTVDNATANAAASDGAAGDAFAQLLQDMPGEHASESSTTLTVAAPTATATATPTDATADALTVTTTTPVTTTESLIVASTADAVLQTWPLTTTIATPTDAEQSEAASSARMMAALRREFVPTPVLTSAVEVPAGKTPTRTQTPSDDTARDAESAATAQQRPALGKTRTPLLTSTSTKAKAATPSATEVDTAAVDQNIVMTAVDADESASDDADARHAGANTRNVDKPIAGVVMEASEESTTAAPLTRSAGRNPQDASVTVTATTDLPVIAGVSALPAANTTTSAKAASSRTNGNRGATLPVSGKGLPPGSASGFAKASAVTADAAAMQSFGNLIDASTGIVTDLANTTIDSIASRAAQPDTSAASSAALTAASGSTNPLGTLPLRSDNPTLQLPPVFTSSVYMGAAGWSEETAQHIRWMQDDDMQSADIQLHPAELGRLDISIDFKDGQANVHLVAGSAEARELLEKSMPSLRELLAQSGMSLGSSNVAADHSGREARQGRFNSTPFPLAEPTVTELPQGRPALFRSYGGSNRIDYYV